MRPLVAPSIISFDYAQMGSSVKALMDAGADWIHFDVMDGQFVPPITFGAQLVADMRKLGDTPFEVHLMTATPERHFDAFIEAGCSRVIFHAEATAHAHRLAQSLAARGVGAGLALNPGTPVEVAEPLLGQLDTVLVMTVNPGWGGQEFIAEALDKVRRLRSADHRIGIEVDGGITPQTIGCAREAGADLFVVGSYLATCGSIPAGMEALRSACG